MVEITTIKLYSVRAARMMRGMSRRQLAEAANLSISTIVGIENNIGQYRTHIGVAVAIADVLGLEVHEIIWPRGLSNKGRPPHTGRPIKPRHLALVANDTNDTESVADVELCSLCNLVLPIIGEIGCCAVA